MREPFEYPYTTTAGTWDGERISSKVIAALRNRPGPVLDLGCGNGAPVRRLLSEGIDAYGVDASESGIRLASQGHPGRFWVCDLESGRLPDAVLAIPFRTVLSIEVIEHMYAPRALVSLAAKVLRSSGGGTFMVSTPYHGYLKNLLIALAGRYDRHHTVLWDGGHIKFFSRATLEAMLREAGFDRLAFQGDGRVPFLWKSMLVSGELR